MCKDKQKPVLVMKKESSRASYTDEN